MKYFIPYLLHMSRYILTKFLGIANFSSIKQLKLIIRKEILSFL